MTENDSTDGARAVKAGEDPSRPVMVRGEVLSTSALRARGFDSRRIAEWKRRGLAPLDWGTNGEFFLSDDIIDLGRKGRKKGTS